MDYRDIKNPFLTIFFRFISKNNKIIEMFQSQPTFSKPIHFPFIIFGFELQFFSYLQICEFFRCVEKIHDLFKELGRERMSGLFVKVSILFDL